MNRLSWANSQKGWLAAAGLGTVLVFLHSFPNIQNLYPQDNGSLPSLVGGLLLAALVFTKERGWLLPCLGFLAVSLPLADSHFSFFFQRVALLIPLLTLVIRNFFVFPRRKNGPQPFLVVFGIYTVWGFISMAMIDFRLVGTVTIVLQAVTFAMMLNLVKAFGRSPYPLRDTMLGAAAGAVVILGYTFLVSPLEGKQAVYPFYQNANFFAAVITVLVPYLGWTAWKSRSWLRYASIAGGAILLLGLVLLESRGAIVGMVGGIAIGLMFLLKNKRFRWLVAAFLAATVAAAAAGGIMQGGKTEFSNGERMMRWEVAFRMVQEEPLSGVGAGGYAEQFKFQLKNSEEVEKISYWYGWERSAHSEYLTHLAERGWIGIGLFLALMGIPLVFVHRLVQRRAWSRDFAAAVATSYGSLLIHAFFNDLFDSTVIFGLFAFTATYLFTAFRQT